MKKEKIFWGLLFVLGAIFIVVSKLGYFNGINAWSLILTVFLAGIFLSSLVRVRFTGIFLSAAFLCIIYKEIIGLNALSNFTIIVVAILFSIGFSILFHNTKWYRKVSKCHCYNFEHKHNNNENFSNVINDEDSDYVELNNSFNSSIKYVNSDNFKKANLKCSFGAIKIYFDNAIIQEDKAYINLDISFSGVELYVPKSWNVINNVNTSLSGFEEKNRNDGTNSKTVVLSGSISFSGVTIIYI